jgi:hypothetical protein
VVRGGERGRESGRACAGRGLPVLRELAHLGSTPVFAMRVFFWNAPGACCLAVQGRESYIWRPFVSTHGGIDTLVGKPKRREYGSRVCEVVREDPVVERMQYVLGVIVSRPPAPYVLRVRPEMAGIPVHSMRTQVFLVEVACIVPVERDRKSIPVALPPRHTARLVGTKERERAIRITRSFAPITFPAALVCGTRACEWKKRGGSEVIAHRHKLIEVDDDFHEAAIIVIGDEHRDSLVE